MAQKRYFIGTSALIVRFLARAQGHTWMRDLCDPSQRNVIILAEITGAEIASALNQLVRAGTIRKSRCDQALTAFWTQIAAGHYQLIPIMSSLVRDAAALCDIHPLRGYDAVQLACAVAAREDARRADATLVATGNTPIGDPIMLTEDNRLRDAAVASGFVVDSPRLHTSTAP